MLDYDRKRLGSFLRDMRESSDWTQLEVSRKLGYTSPQFISNIERGISVVPLKTLSRMIQLYKADPEQVVNLILESQRRFLKIRLMKSR
jgi:transcriptional regulator with XRE-family HTH domain